MVRGGGKDSWVLHLLALLLHLPNSCSSAVTIICHYPDAMIQTLGGHFLSLRGVGCPGWSWQDGKPLTRTRPDTHELTACGGPGEFKLMIDDQLWMRGSNARLTSRAAALHVYPWFNRSAGQIQVISTGGFNGQATREVAVYLPAGYLENTLKPFPAPVLVAHDGQNLFDGNQCPECCSFGCWGLDGVLDGLQTERAVLGIYNSGADRMDEYTYSADPQFPGEGGHLDSYLDYIESSVLPDVAKQLPRLTGALPTARPWPMLGSSLGGLASCYAGWTRSASWGPAVCMSSSFWWNSRDFLGRRVLMNRTVHPSSSQRLWVDWGDAESSDQQGSNQAVVAELESQGWTVESGRLGTYVQPGGRHNEASWGARVSRPLEWLQSKVL